MSEQELRELDAWIAEHVFGFVWDERRCRICGWLIGEKCCRPNDDCSMRPHPERRADAPGRYSTDISAACEVLENMREKGYGLTIFTSETEGYGAIVTRYIKGRLQNEAWPGKADTPALAICLAAKSATEEPTR